VAPRSDLPTGTVAFLFSDIEGSTQRWERDRAAMGDALRRHDALVRSAIERNRGYVFKTIGDAFCAAFATIPDAVAAALAIQRDLANDDFSEVEDLRVRIGLHAGSAEERDGDYFGPTLNRVARLQATAWGGQTILSAAAAELARPALPPEATLRDLGLHRLKDLAEPETIAQLVVPDLPSDFPPLRSLDASLHNLPTQLLPLIGRETVVAEIEAALAEARLVTLAGAGGIGKTRTALHVAADLLERYPGGVWYAELAPVSDETQVAPKIAADLGLRETPGRSALDTLLSWLAAREALLVIDNCEQVVGEAARVADAVIKRSGKTRVLATSREPLHVYGERVVRLPSLPEAEAVALFVDRAFSADTRFALTPASAPIVADICRRLDGIALAIELAASRVKILTPPQLLAKLDERFRVLGGGRREALPHHATLLATIAWSFDLLPERERLVFERLGIFAGAWPLEAALEVCADADLDEFETIDAVEALANKSLIAVEGETDAKAYRLLESTRAFAQLKLRERGAYDESRSRHAAYALRVAERLDACALVTPTAEWERQMRDANADVHAAIAWALRERNDEPLGIALVANLRWYWSGLAAVEGRELVALALAAAERVAIEPALLVRLQLADAAIATSFGDHARQLEASERARSLAESVGERLEAAMALRTYAQALYFLGRGAEAEPLLRAALGEFRALDCKRFAALTLDVLAIQRWSAGGDLDVARAELEEAVALAAETGFERGMLFLDTNLAEVEFALGNVGAAIALGERAVHRTYATRESLSLAIAWSNLAMYYAVEQRWPEAQSAADCALGFAHEADTRAYADFALQTLAAVQAKRGEWHTAAQVLGFVDARLVTLGLERGTTEQAAYARLLAALREHFGAGLEAVLAAGAALSDDAVERLAAPLALTG
jgi:predicted ATPase/class 3 adenylate cyclase